MSEFTHNPHVSIDRLEHKNNVKEKSIMNKKYVLALVVAIILCISICVFTDYVQLRWAEKAYALEIEP